LTNQTMNKQPIKNKWLPAIYASYYPILRDIAIEHGYALAIHGTLTRDFDLIAVAWTNEAKTPIELLTAISKKVGTHRNIPYVANEEKPHGRTSYVIQAGSGGYFDISIIPPKPSN
jgi:hypothetical protein